LIVVHASYLGSCLPALQTGQERAMSDVLRTALSASIRLDQMPKTCVDVFVMVGRDRVGPEKITTTIHSGGDVRSLGKSKFLLAASKTNVHPDLLTDVSKMSVCPPTAP